MKRTETVLLLTVQLAPAVASLLLTDSHKTGPEPEKDKAGEGIEASVGLQAELRYFSSLEETNFLSLVFLSLGNRPPGTLACPNGYCCSPNPAGFT